MRPRYWLLTTLSTILIVTAAIAGLNMAVDVYGLYRPSRGHRLPVYGDDRVAKYLLSMRYVPENFNAVIVGASISANWDITAIEGLRVYNGSLDGGNIVEEKALIEAALERPGVSVILLLVNPSLTYSHEFETVELKPELKRSALGSLSLWNAYRNMLSIRLGRTPQPFDYAGTETFLNARSEMNVNMKAMWSEAEFTVDPAALRAYLDLVANLRARGVRIVFIVPPVSEHLLETKRAPLDRYWRLVDRLPGPGKRGILQNACQFLRRGAPYARWRSSGGRSTQRRRQPVDRRTAPGSGDAITRHPLTPRSRAHPESGRSHRRSRGSLFWARHGPCGLA
jgi:hypothetical protein